MSTSPYVTALRNRDSDLAWESCASRNNSSASINQPFLHPVPPTDPFRQAKRIPIKVLKMLTARTGHILHPEYLQPLPSTPISPIEVRHTFGLFSISFERILVLRNLQNTSVENWHFHVIF